MLGQHVGPDLTGTAVHPKQELLTHILDPNRNVEGNYRSYTVLTLDGMVYTGLLASESTTSIELIDAQGKHTNLLRGDIEEFVASPISIMPEGFENKIDVKEMADLLQFLAGKDKYVTISMDRYATAVSTRGMFHNDGPDRFVFADWGQKWYREIPFQLTDPHGESRPNVILLNSTQSRIPSLMPMSVTLPCNMAARSIHFLSGVAGWGYPCDPAPSITMTVRLNYRDGKSEDHPLVNGIHFADYVRRVDVPGSEFAFGFDQGQQLRYLEVSPRRDVTIASIELIKGTDNSAPVVVAVTIEPLPDPTFLSPHQ